MDRSAPVSPVVSPVAWAGSGGTRPPVGPAVVTASDGRVASPPGVGRAPVSSSYSSTPSPYTSVAVVIGPPAVCSGAA